MSPRFKLLICFFLIKISGSDAIAAPTVDLKNISNSKSGRVSLLYQMNKFTDFAANTINPYTWVNGVGFGYELGMPIQIVTGLSYFSNKDITVTWKGTADTPVELYCYLIKGGLKFTLPLPFFQPWAGAGVEFGVLTYSNPNDREFNSFMVAVYSRGSQTIKHLYGEVGIDFSLGTSGIRIAGKQNKITSSKVAEIGDQPYDNMMTTYSAGIFANF